MEQKIIHSQAETPAVSPPDGAPRKLSAREHAEAFYYRVTKRSDVREILSRLAKK